MERTTIEDCKKEISRLRKIIRDQQMTLDLSEKALNKTLCAVIRAAEMPELKLTVPVALMREEGWVALMKEEKDTVVFETIQVPEKEK